VTWAEAADLWQRIDGVVMFGPTLYLYLLHRNALRSLRRANKRLRLRDKAIESQEVVIEALYAAARARGIELSDEPPRLH